MLWKILAIIFMADYLERVWIVPLFQKWFFKRHKDAEAIYWGSQKMTAEMMLANIEDEEEESEGD